MSVESRRKLLVSVYRANTPNWRAEAPTEYEASFDADRQALGLSGPPFDYFFRAVESYLGNYPWKYSEEVRNSGGIRMLPTRDAFPDIPPLYVYYRVESSPNKIVFLGLSPAWSQSETL